MLYLFLFMMRFITSYASDPFFKVTRKLCHITVKTAFHLTVVLILKM
jgi:hypothetical protein